MGNRETTPFPRIWAISAGMGFGPIEIPSKHRKDEDSAIAYTVELMRVYIRGRAVIQWDPEGKKRASEFSRDGEGNSCLLIK